MKKDKSSKAITLTEEISKLPTLDKKYKGMLDHIKTARLTFTNHTHNL